MREVRRLAIAYGAASLGWLAVAGVVLPAILAEVYRGRGPRWLGPLADRIGRPPRHPLGFYVDHLGQLTAAVLLAMGCHALLVAGPIRRRFHRRAWRLALGATSGLFLGVAVLSGPRQDYAAYLEIWRHALDGGDPWWVHPRLGYRLNAYGPLFPALATLAAVHPLAPKLLVATATLAMLVATVARRRHHRALWAVALLGYPGLWIHAAWYGHFDAAVAATCVAAVALREQGGRDAAAGAWLGAGILLKYQPAPLLPFLALGTSPGRRGWGVRTIAACVVAVAAGLALARVVWGPSVFAAIGSAAGRGSLGASVWRALRGGWSPAGNVDALALPAMAAALLALLAYGVRRSIPCGAACAAASLVVVNLYPVGFGQYQAVPLALLAWAWPDGDGDRPARRLAAAGLVYAGAIALYDAADLAAGGFLNHPGRWGRIDDFAGLGLFALAAWLLAEWLAAFAPRR